MKLNASNYKSLIGLFAKTQLGSLVTLLHRAVTFFATFIFLSVYVSTLWTILQKYRRQLWVALYKKLMKSTGISRVYYTKKDELLVGMIKKGRVGSLKRKKIEHSALLSIETDKSVLLKFKKLGRPFLQGSVVRIQLVKLFLCGCSCEKLSTTVYYL